MAKQKDPRVLIWDIEASDLKGNFGFVFCIGYKWLGEKKTHLISIRDYPAFNRDITDDRAVLKAFAKVMEEADLMVTHYGQRFDYPFLNTRCMIHGMKPMPSVPHVDTWRIAKYKLALHSNRLDTLSRVIPVSGVRELKTPLEAPQWMKGRAGHVPSIRYIEAHCRADVRVLEDVYVKIRPFSSNLPNLAKHQDGVFGCPACGSEKVHARGYHLTAHGKRRRYQCQGCGQWFSAPRRIKV